jgi:hypothetical protein
MSGFMFNIPLGDLIATGVFQVPAYSGDKTYERTASKRQDRPAFAAGSQDGERQQDL